MFTESPAGKLEAQGRASAAAAAADKPISAKDKATIQRVLSSPGPGVQKVLDAMYSSNFATKTPWCPLKSAVCVSTSP
jgi:hypothetical protein